MLMTIPSLQATVHMSTWARHHVKTVANETVKKVDSMRAGQSKWVQHSWTKEFFEANFADK